MPGRTKRDPIGPILSRLGRLRWTKDVVNIANVAGIVFDLKLSQKDDYSHSKRIAAYLPRIQRAIKKLTVQEQLASASVLARELIARGFADPVDIAQELETIGWRLADNELAPIRSGAKATATAPSLKPASDPHIRTAVVYAALELEAQAMIEHLEDPRDELHPHGTVYVCGTLHEGAANWRVAIVTGGMGNAAAAVEVERAVAHFGPEVLLLVGIAGGLKDVRLGDVVAADKVHAYEGGKSAEDFLPRPVSWPAGYAAVQRARHAMGDQSRNCDDLPKRRRLVPEIL